LKGKVFLVGAGPGGAWLAPSGVFGLLRSADAVLYDSLVDPSLLSSAFKAEKIFVGKTVGRHSMTQDQINELMIRLAREGKVVVRLKGGDPFVLGRGDEECEALLRAGVECEVVPAPTSATAVPACAGIPVTRRNLANTFAVATGWAAEGSERPKYGEMLKVVDTLVVLMGVSKVEEIARDVVRAAGDVPSAAIMKGCTEEQKVVIARASELPEAMRRNGVKPPSVLVFGEVVRWAWESGLAKDVLECSL